MIPHSASPTPDAMIPHSAKPSPGLGTRQDNGHASPRMIPHSVEIYRNRDRFMVAADATVRAAHSRQT
eukprot:503330-Prymnesium_polylepis.1